MPLLLEPGAFLTALQLADSAFPTGMYAHSHGLEGMVRRGLVSCAADLEEFLATQMIWSLLPSDGIALLEAHRHGEDGDVETVVEIDRLLYAMKLPAELRAASTQVGRRLLTETTSTGQHTANGGRRACGVLGELSARVAAGATPGNSAVAFGVAAAGLGIPAEAALLASCHSFLMSGLGAALRLLPLTHRDTQAILRRLQPLLVVEVERMRGCGWRQMTCFTPELDLVAAGHELDDVRMFAS